ncbi:MAG: hypothetical protein ACYCX4_02095 [Bacillota bacterium]
MLPDVIALPLNIALAFLEKSGYEIVEQNITSPSRMEEHAEGVYRVVRVREVGVYGVSLVLARQVSREPVKGGGTYGP